VPKRSLVLISCLLAAALWSCGGGEDDGADFGRGGTPPNDDDVTADDDDADDPDADADGDGYPASVDCDDDDAWSHPGAPELCDDADNNCNGEVDEEPLADLVWYYDGDGDGWGTPDVTETGCIAPDGYVLQGGDCDDEVASIHPGAHIDGYDADCDGRLEWRVEIQLTVVASYFLCADDQDDEIGSDNQWENAETYHVWLDSGEHTIGFVGVGQEWDKGEDENDLTGALITVRINDDDDTQWWSNSNWKYDSNPTADEDTRTGWCSPGFDDSSWEPVREFTQWGSAPWGEVPPEMADAGGSWIWDDVPIEHNTQYFRLDITLP